MTLYTAVRYRNDMSVFDHRTDGVVVRSTTADGKPAVPSGAGARKIFSVSQVMMMMVMMMTMAVMTMLLNKHSVLVS